MNAARASRRQGCSEPNDAGAAAASPALRNLLGHLAVHHDGHGWQIRSERADLAPRLMPGTAIAEAPRRIAALFSLCSSAHALAARLAIRAAQGGQIVCADIHDHAQLARDTAREHLQRMALGWPSARAAGQPDRANESKETARSSDIAALACSPLWQASDPLAALQALPDWLARSWSGGDAHAWQHACTDAAQADDLLRAAPSHAARRLRSVLALADQLPVGAITGETGFQAGLSHALLTGPMAAARRRSLAQELITNPGLAMRPRLREGAAETGCWNRAFADPAHTASPATLRSRLLARWQELWRLARAVDGEPVLAAGAEPVGDGQALAWVEMSRGVLLHRVALEGTHADARVAGWQVIAPTEWNVHPQGVLARQLAAWPADVDESALRLAIDSVDPCLPLALRRSPRAHIHRSQVQHA